LVYYSALSAKRTAASVFALTKVPECFCVTFCLFDQQGCYETTLNAKENSIQVMDSVTLKEVPISSSIQVIFRVHTGQEHERTTKRKKGGRYYNLHVD
jgi:hypothetical protein